MGKAPERMKCMSPSRSGLEYTSVKTIESRNREGVTFVIRRISLQRRADLACELMAVAPQLEFAAAGTSASDQLKATQLVATVCAIYLRWGLVEVRGLTIDGEAASAELLLERGPEDLAEEITSAIRQECGLTGEERKN